jgi:hypothetical protein
MMAAAIRRAANPSLSAIAPITVPKMTLLSRNAETGPSSEHLEGGPSRAGGADVLHLSRGRPLKCRATESAAKLTPSMCMATGHVSLG